MSWREVGVETGMAREPSLDCGRFVSREVVHDDVDSLVGRDVLIDRSQELEKLLGSVSGTTASDHAPGLDIQRGEKRQRAVSRIGWRPPRGRSRQHRQQGLRPIEGLYLRLLVDAENHGVVWGLHVKPDDISELLGEQRVS